MSVSDKGASETSKKGCKMVRCSCDLPDQYTAKESGPEIDGVSYPFPGEGYDAQFI